MLIHDEIPVLADVDIVIIGAGSAGCCAAIAAAQHSSHSVLLIERYGYPGGTSTGVLDTFYGFFTPGDQPRKVVGGIPDRVVDRLHQADAMFLRPNTYGAGTGVTYNPQRLKLVWDQLLREAGVDILLHCTLVDVETSSLGEISSAVIHTRGGLRRIRARRWIDTSGDAEFCHLAELAYEKAGDLEPAQTLTTTFQLANIDINRYQAAGGKRLLNQQMQQAVETGVHALPRRSGSLHRMTTDGCMATVATRIADIDAMDSRQLTQAEQEGRRQAFVYEMFLRACVTGFEAAEIVALSTQIGVRETRRVCGEYRLTRDDCLSVRRFEDVVLLCGAPIEDHRAGSGNHETAWAYVPGSQAYDVPYRTLIPQGSDTVWVAGRCFSATHDAHASCRSMGQTMSMGQAVGLAAALSLDENCGARDVPIGTLQSQLQQQGAVLETPSTIAATAAKAWQDNRKEIDDN